MAVFTPEVIVTIECVCSVFVFALLCYTIRRYERKNLGDRYFMLLCVINMIQLLSDAVILLVDGKNEVWCHWCTIFSYFMEFATGGWVCLCFTNFLCEYLSLETEKKKIVRKWMLIIGFAETAIVVLNLFVGFYYSIDPVTNVYTRGPLWIVSQILGVIPVIFSGYLFVKYGFSLFRTAWVGTLIYVLIPFMGMLIQIFVSQMPVTFMLMSLSLYLLFFNVKTEQAYLMEKQRKELAESRISIMLSQIQPHFMYNALTSIAVLCEKDPKEAKRATINFSRYLRKNIDSVNKRMPVTFSSELEHVQTYLEIEKLRFGDRLKVEMDIKAKDFLIPPLTIQPIAENAVKHGICNKMDTEGTLTIRSREYPDRYEVEIEDDGVGFDVNRKLEDGREHIGIENVRARLMTMSNAKLIVTSKIGVGTLAKVVIPKEVFKEQ